MKKQTIKVKVNRSAVSGQFVTEDYMKKHKKTTITQTIKKKS